MTRFWVNARHLAGTAVTALALATPALAGPYSGPADQANPYDAAISKNAGIIQYWADQVVDYSPTPGVSASYQNPETGYGSLGDLDADQIAAGVAPGSITLGFSQPITDQVGKDFAVFENGMSFGGENGVSIELAYVEVSTDGTNFARFDSVSLNTGPLPGGWPGYSGYDVTNIYNLAGKHQAGWGTPFDLAELSNHALVLAGLVDLNAINYVRLVDIPGNGSFTDTASNLINPETGELYTGDHGIVDNWLTWGSGGYDFRLTEGIAVIPEPASIALFTLGGLLLIRRKRTA